MPDDIEPDETVVDADVMPASVDDEPEKDPIDILLMELAEADTGPSLVPPVMRPPLAKPYAKPVAKPDTTGDGSESDRSIADMAAGTLSVPGGTISYYESKKAYQAVCMNDDHKLHSGSRCRLTRAANKQPLGLMVRWLSNHACACDHRTTKYTKAPFAERKQSRDDLASDPMAQHELIRFEPEEGSGGEPIVCP